MQIMDRLLIYAFFFDSIKYKDIASTTKAGFCITTDKLKMYLPTACTKIVVKSVLFEVA